MKRTIPLIGVALVAVLLAWLLQPGVDEPRASRDIAPGTAPPALAAPEVTPVEATSRPRQAAAPAAAPTDAETAALRARLEDLRKSEKIDAVCLLEPPVTEADAYLAVGDPAAFDGRRVSVVLGYAFLPYLDEAGAGLLTVPGYAPAKVSWGEATDDGPAACAPRPVVLREGIAAITGTVRHEGNRNPARGAWVEGCGGLSNADDDGGYYMEVVPGPCELKAMRQDGQLRTISEPVEVHPKEGRDLVVDLSIPGWPRAGLGIAVEETDGGFFVGRVLEGTAAASAGLVAGDKVLEIDGEQTAEMELEEFVEKAGGQEGSEVVLVVERDGEAQVVRVERAPVGTAR